MAELLVSMQSTLQGAARFWSGLPYLPLLAGHCLFCVTMAPEAKPNFLLHFWLTYLGGFAGGILSSIVLMSPSKAPISLLSSNKSGLTFTACWWLMTYSPLAPLLNYIYNIKPVKMASKACVAYMRANLVINRVLVASQLFNGIFMAPILIGTLASCGGKCSLDAIKHMYGLGSGPAEFTVPTYSFRSAFLGSALFYLTSLCPVTMFLTPEEAAGAIITLFVLQSVMFDLNIPFDWSEVLLRIILGVSNIPWPAGVPQPIKAAAVAIKPKSSGATPAGPRAADTIPTAASEPVQPKPGTALARSRKATALAATPTQANGSSPAQPAAVEGQLSVDDDAALLAAALADIAAEEQAGGQARSKAGRRKKSKAGGEAGGWQLVTSKNRRPEQKKTK